MYRLEKPNAYISKKHGPKNLVTFVNIPFSHFYSIIFKYNTMLHEHCIKINRHYNHKFQLQYWHFNLESAFFSQAINNEAWN